MLNEAKNLLNTFKVWAIVLGLLTAVFFALPSPLHSFSTMLIELIKADLLPQGVEFIVTDPMNAFSAQLSVALFLGFIASLPIFLYQLISYLSPALYEHERSAAAKVVLPGVALFVAGGLFAYYILSPEAIKFLYAYAEAVNAASFITVKQLVTFVLSMVVFTGILFLLPVFMILLTRLGLVAPSFWRQNARYAVAGALILSAVITPDGSGVTMMLLALPLTGLYIVGYKVAKSTNQLINTNQQAAQAARREPSRSDPSRISNNWALDD